MVLNKLAQGTRTHVSMYRMYVLLCIRESSKLCSVLCSWKW